MYLKYPLFFFTSTPGWKGLHFNYGLGYKAHLVWGRLTLPFVSSTVF